MLPSGDENIAILVTNATNARFFSGVRGSNPTESFFTGDQIVHQNGEFVVSDPVGNQLHFFDFSPGSQLGQFKSLIDADGNQTFVVSWNSNGTPTEVQRTTPAGVTPVVTESYVYSYIPSGGNAGLLSNETLRRQTNGGAWVVARQVVYTYYGTGDPNGNLGDLRSAQIEDDQGNILDTKYYRYYPRVGSGPSIFDGLKYVLNGDSYARLVAGFGDPLTTNVPEMTIAQYADMYLEYNTANQVSLERLQGAGCSSCSGGQGTYQFLYATPSGFSPGPNRWYFKTIETLPDGNTNTVYSNQYGEVMLKVFHNTSTGQNWEWFTKYDGSDGMDATNKGRPIMSADPSAIQYDAMGNGYSESTPDLLNADANGHYQYLKDNAGLVHITDYYTTTSPTISDTVSGGVAGYVQDMKLQQGQAPTGQQPIQALQNTMDYFAHTGGSATVYPVAHSTVYQNDSGSNLGPETTTYSYSWYATSTRPLSVTTQQPVITVAQNGPSNGAPDVYTTFFDVYGRPVWTRNSITPDPNNPIADGFIYYMEYDQATGALTKTIQDVQIDAQHSADYQNPPAGWTTPTGGGLHLITRMTVDRIGRTTFGYSAGRQRRLYGLQGSSDHQSKPCARHAGF